MSNGAKQAFVPAHIRWRGAAATHPMVKLSEPVPPTEPRGRKVTADDKQYTKADLDAAIAEATKAIEASRDEALREAKKALREAKTAEDALEGLATVRFKEYKAMKAAREQVEREKAENAGNSKALDVRIQHLRAEELEHLRGEEREILRHRQQIRLGSHCPVCAQTLRRTPLGNLLRMFDMIGESIRADLMQHKWIAPQTAAGVTLTRQLLAAARRVSARNGRTGARASRLAAETLTRRTVDYRGSEFR